MLNFKSWLSRHVNDEFVKSSKIEGFRARSAFKLLQILDKYPQLLKPIKKPNSSIIDLGAAPGSWSQAIISRASATATVLAVDLLPLEPMPKVKTLKLDFTAHDSLQILAIELKCDEKEEQNVDLIISDLCANLTGNSCVDNANNLNLWELAFKLTCGILVKNGHFVIKYFESQESIRFRRDLEKSFNQVHVFKPKASRSESSEKYFICLNKN